MYKEIIENYDLIKELNLYDIKIENNNIIIKIENEFIAKTLQNNLIKYFNQMSKLIIQYNAYYYCMHKELTEIYNLIKELNLYDIKIENNNIIIKTENEFIAKILQENLTKYFNQMSNLLTYYNS